jgi:hypothetical protein
MATRNQAVKMKVDMDRESQMVWLTTNLVHDICVISYCVSNLRNLLFPLIMSTAFPITIVTNYICMPALNLSSRPIKVAGLQTYNRI